MTARELYDKLTLDDLRDRYGPDVVGYGVGTKHTDGQDTGEPAIIVYVREKLPVADMEAMGIADRILPDELDGVAVDVEEGGTPTAGLHGPRLHGRPADAGDLNLVRAGFAIRKRLRRMRQDGKAQIDLDDLDELLEQLCGDREPPLTARQRPVQPGYSCGHPDVTAGTIGVLVRHKGNPAILSNNHVIADTNRADLGDPIWQPGRHDGGGSDDAIGTLSAWVDVGFGSAVNTIEDSAVAHLDAEYLQEIPRGVGVPAGVTPEPEIAPGQAVKKVGRTTGLTNGSVRTFPTSARVQYGDGKVAQYEDLVGCTDISDPGDSGSGILDDGNRYQSLLFAGSDFVTLGQVASRIFDRFDLEVLE